MALLAGFMIFIAISALMYSIMSTRVVARASVDRRLARARGLETAAATASVDIPLRANRFSRAGGGLARALANLQTARRLSDLLERANWPLSVTEFLAITGISGMLGFIVLRALNPRLALLGALLGLLLPYLALRRAVVQRRNRFNKQLVEALTLIANALRAGSGLLQAIDQTANQLSAPIADELKRTLHDIQMGASPDEAFEALNQRIRSEDLDITVTAIIVQRATGGNLAEVLDNVAQTMRERIRIRGEIKTLTIQQQASGYLLGAMPLLLIFMFNIINRNYMKPLFTSDAGHVMLLVGGFMELMGFLFIRKIVNIDI